MKDTGTLEEVMGKTFDLYTKNQVSDFSLKRFLKKMGVFSDVDILKLVEMLHEAKENEGV